MFKRCAGAPGNIVALQIQSNRFRLFGCLCLIICSSGFQVRLRSLAPNCDLIVKGQIVEKEHGKTVFFFFSLWPIWVTIILILFLATWNPPDARRTEGLSLAEGKGSLKYEIQMYNIYKKSYYSG